MKEQAIVWAIQKFRGYVDGLQVKLITYHDPQNWIMSIKLPTGRLARWELSFKPFNNQIEYIVANT